MAAVVAEEALAVSRSVPSLSELGAEFGAAEKNVANGFSNFWKSLSSNVKSFSSGTGGKVVKVGAQVGSAVALPAAGIYALNTATQPEQQAINTLTGGLNVGGLVPLIMIAVVFLLVVLVIK